MREIRETWAHWSCVLSKRDPKLSPLIRAIGPPQICIQRVAFRALVEAILSQQLAFKAAHSIIGRVARLDPPFPTGRSLQRQPVNRLRRAGVSPQKINYLRELSERWEDPQWRRGWSRLSDTHLIERLTQVKGVGEWTAQMFLIFSLGRPNVLPVGDFGVRRGVQILRGLSQMPLPRQLPEYVGNWEGAYSVASWYLWQALDRKLIG